MSDSRLAELVSAPEGPLASPLVPFIPFVPLTRPFTLGREAAAWSGSHEGHILGIGSL